MIFDHNDVLLSTPTTKKNAISLYTEKQGQYLAFIYYYTKVNGQPPAESDIQRYFKVSPPTVHYMIIELEKKGLVSREAKKPRSLKVRLNLNQLPVLI